VDHIDQGYLETRQIKLASAAGCSKHAVAQYVIAVIHLLRPQLVNSNDLSKKPVLGIVGFGHIGSTLARYAQALGFDLLICDPFVASPHPQTSLSELLSQSDVISLHVPLTGQNDADCPHPTHHLIAEPELALIKPGALLINSARGAVISQSALLSALESGAFDAALDVFEFEPVISSALLMRLALATPHIAGYSAQGKLNATRLVSAELGRHFGFGGDTQAPLERFWLPSDLSGFLPKWYDPRVDEAALKSCLIDSADAQTGQLNRLSQPDLKPSKVTDPTCFEALRRNYSLRTDWGFVNLASGGEPAA
jgi:erythronate-4-phosphate dehydrogenase